MRTFVAKRSTNIKQVWYNAETDVLSVQFKSGAGYLYLGVPTSTFESFRKAKSKGRYFTTKIRNAYTFQKDVFANVA